MTLASRVARRHLSRAWGPDDYISEARVKVVHLLPGFGEGLNVNPSYVRNRRLGVIGVVTNCMIHNARFYWWVKNKKGYYSIYLAEELEPQDGYEEYRRLPEHTDPPMMAMFRWDAGKREWVRVPQPKITIFLGRDENDTDSYVIDRVEGGQ